MAAGVGAGSGAAGVWSAAQAASASKMSLKTKILLIDSAARKPPASLARWRKPGRASGRRKRRRVCESGVIKVR